ncbi:GNAT family N-acetyltransferase [Clostridium sp. CTA-19]
MIYLKEVTGENWRKIIRLKVTEEQQCYVSSNTGILAKAYAYLFQRSQAKVIYDDCNIVGLIMYRDYDERNAYILDQLMIDSKFQRKGYGEKAVLEAIKIMKNDKKYNRIILCYCEGDNAAKNLYTKLGFYHTGEVDENEIIMALDF